MVRLSNLGIGDVRVTGGEEFAGREDVGRDRGLWESISDFFFPAEDRATCAEGLPRGGFLVTATNVPADHYDEALEILDAEGLVDLGERAESWRAEGRDVTGTATDVAPDAVIGGARLAAGTTAEGRSGAVPVPPSAPVEAEGTRACDADGTSHDDVGMARDDNVIPIGRSRPRSTPRNS